MIQPIITGGIGSMGGAGGSGVVQCRIVGSNEVAALLEGKTIKSFRKTGWGMWDQFILETTDGCIVMFDGPHDEGVVLKLEACGT